MTDESIIYEKSFIKRNSFWIGCCIIIIIYAIALRNMNSYTTLSNELLEEQKNIQLLKIEDYNSYEEWQQDTNRSLQEMEKKAEQLKKIATNSNIYSILIGLILTAICFLMYLNNRGIKKLISAIIGIYFLFQIIIAFFLIIFFIPISFFVLG